MSHHEELDTLSSPSSVLARAFDVLGTFSPDFPQRHMTDIAQEAGLPKSTTHRLLSQLVDLGVLERSGQIYRLGSRLFALGSMSAEESLRRLALPYLHQLQSGADAEVSLVILSGQRVLPLQRVGGVKAKPAPSAPPRKVVPLHCSAAGKLLLSFAEPSIVDSYASMGLSAVTPRSISDARRLRDELGSIASRGIATEEGENDPTSRCVSAPIFVGAKAVAALSIIASTGEEWKPGAVGLLRATASGITNALAQSRVRSLFVGDYARAG